MIILSSINCPTVIRLPTVCYFSREKPLVKSTAPGSLSHIICLCDLFYFAFIFRSIKPKYKNTLLQFILFGIRSINLYNFLPSTCQFLAPLPEGIDNPFNTSGCEWLLFCAGAVY